MEGDDERLQPGLAYEVALPLISNVHPELDLEVIVETDRGISASAAVPSLTLEPGLSRMVQCCAPLNHCPKVPAPAYWRKTAW